MILWLKHEADLHGTWTIAQINVIPTGVQAISIVSGILATSLVMIYPIWTAMSFVAAVLLFANIYLLVWDIPVGLHCESSLHYIVIANFEFSRRILYARIDFLCYTHTLPLG